METNSGVKGRGKHVSSDTAIYRSLCFYLIGIEKGVIVIGVKARGRRCLG